MIIFRPSLTSYVDFPSPAVVPQSWRNIEMLQPDVERSGYNYEAHQALPSFLSFLYWVHVQDIAKMFSKYLHHVYSVGGVCMCVCGGGCRCGCGG